MKQIEFDIEDLYISDQISFILKENGYDLVEIDFNTFVLPEFHKETEERKYIKKLKEFLEEENISEDQYTIGYS